MGDVPNPNGEFPNATGDVPNEIGELPNVTGDVPNETIDVPNATGDVPNLIGEASLGSKQRNLPSLRLTISNCDPICDHDFEKFSTMSPDSWPLNLEFPGKMPLGRTSRRA